MTNGTYDNGHHSEQVGVLTGPPEKLAPHSAEAEEALLGSILINPDSLLDALQFVSAADFFVVRNAWIFEALCAVHERNEDLDNLTVMEELRNRNQLEQVGGLSALMSLVNNTPTHIHAETYARVIAKAAFRRRMIIAATDIAQSAFQDNIKVDDLIANIWSIMDTATDNRGGGAGLLSFSEAANSAMDEWLAWADDPGEVRGYRTGLKPLDYMVGGFLPGRVMGLIMPTSGGKSTVTRQMFKSLIEQSPGLLVPTEMSANAMLHGIVTQQLGLDALDIQRGNSDPRIMNKYAELMNKRAYILQSARPAYSEIETMARKLRRKFGNEPLWMIVDSGSNVDVPKANIFERTSKVSNTLAKIAIDYNYFVIVTWQTNRASYSQESAGITSGRGGGEIEHDSDYLFTVERPWYKYKAGLVSQQPEGYKEYPDNREPCHFICRKSRHNPIMGRQFDAWWVPGKGVFPQATDE